MPPTTPRQFRLSDAELDALDELGAIWDPVKPLTRTDVIREMLRRTLLAERRRPSRRTETDKAK
jgi:hypothetical protein